MSGRVEETRVVINVWEFRGCHWSMQGHLIVSGRKEEEEERGRGHYKKTYGVVVLQLSRTLPNVGPVWLCPQGNLPRFSGVGFWVPGAEIVAWPASCLAGHDPNSYVECGVFQGATKL